MSDVAEPRHGRAGAVGVAAGGPVRGLLTEYETGLARYDRTQIRLQRSSAACRAAR